MGIRKGGERVGQLSTAGGAIHRARLGFEEARRPYRWASAWMLARPFLDQDLTRHRVACDLGSGPGAFSAQMKRLFPWLRSIATDINFYFDAYRERSEADLLASGEEVELAACNVMHEALPPADPVLPLLNAEREANTSAGFLRSLADEARYHRPGSLPLIGRPAIEADPAARASGLKCGSLGAAQARSADLGYSYGRCELLLADAGAPGGLPAKYYLRVWRRNASGAWQIVAQVDQPDGR